MSLNCNEINSVLSELNLSGTFLQDVVQPNFDSLALYTFRPGEPKTVFISLAASACRIHEVRRKIPKNEKPLRFNELLRARIKGARIVSAEQIALERIVKIELLKTGTIFVMPAAQEKLAKKQKNRETEEAQDERLFLYIRLWSGAANIFLCDEDNTIIDCFFRRPKKDEISGKTFTLPAPKPQTRDFPVRDFLEIESEYQKSNPSSPPLSFCEKIDRFYSAENSESSLSSLLEQAEKWYEAHFFRLSAALSRLNEKRAEFLDCQKLRHFGDLILSNAHKIDGKSNFVECEDWENDGKIVRVKIDPKKTAHENAHDFFTQYKKAESGREALENDIVRTEKEIARLKEKYESLKAEKNPLKLEQLLRKTQLPKQIEKKEQIGLSYDFDGWRILVGRTAEENDLLLRHEVRGSDWWLHTRDFPGGYVFIKNRVGKTVPLEILLYAGTLAVHFSKARKNGEADLYYTQVKHLRRAKNAPKGTVLPTNEKNLFIKIEEKRLLEIEEHAL